MKYDKLSWSQMVRDAEEKKQGLFEYLRDRAAAQMECTPEQVMEKMSAMLTVMEEAVDFGLTGVRSNSGLTGGSAKKMREMLEERQKGEQPTLLGPVASDAVVFSLATAECNAAMGRIVAAPTAGASGVLPGMLLALRKHYGLSRETVLEGLLVAGMIGEVIANRASISGASGGCQAECGSGAAMAAGAAVHMLGGDGKQIDAAISIVFKDMLGLVCDPVAGLVEVPCIKRNAGSVMQALLAAEMSLADIGSFIPADEAIDAMKLVGNCMSSSLRETAGGGMAATPTAREWARNYFAAGQKKD